MTHVTERTNERHCLWRGRHALGDHEEEDTEGEEDGDAEGDLLAALRGQVEDKQSDDRDEGARHHQVEDVVQVFSLQQTATHHT